MHVSSHHPSEVFSVKRMGALMMFLLLLAMVPAFSAANVGAVQTNLSGYAICVDAGHGGKDPGAIGVKEVKEKDINSP